MKDTRKKLKAVNEVEVGVKPQERPKDNQGGASKSKASKSGKAFAGAKKMDINQNFPRSKANL